MCLSALLVYRPIEKRWHIDAAFSKDTDIFWNSLRPCRSLPSLKDRALHWKARLARPPQLAPVSFTTTHVWCVFSSGK